MTQFTVPAMPVVVPLALAFAFVIGRRRRGPGLLLALACIAYGATLVARR